MRRDDSSKGFFSKRSHFFFFASVLSLLLLTAALVFYYYTTTAIKNEKANELRAIAQLKLNQISFWIGERYADATIMAKSPFINSATIKYLQQEDPALKDEIQHQLSVFLNVRSADGIFILDDSLKILIHAGHHLERFSEVAFKNINSVINKNSITATDIYFCDIEKESHLDFIAPIAFVDGVPKAYLILRLNASTFLFPLIQSWPTPSKTSETLLLRREGESVVFLNELRHKKGTALKFSIPLGRNDIAAVRAALGYKGILEAKDYRGVNILAYVSDIPKTNWFMVSKIDLEEIYSEVYYRGSIIAIITIILLISILLGLVQLSNNKRIKYYRKIVEAEEQFQTTLNSIGDAVITTDMNGNVIYMNPIAENLTGWKESESKLLHLSKVFRIINEETRETAPNPVEKTIEKGMITKLANHTLLISKTGAETPIADSAAPIKDEEGNILGVVLVFRDQTEERRSRREISRLNRVYALLSNTNQAIVRIGSEGELFSEICDISSRDGKFQLTWIGTYDKETNSLKVEASAGQIKVSAQYSANDFQDMPHCNELFAGIKESRSHIIINNIPEATGAAPYREQLQKMELNSCAAFPVFLDNEIFGAVIFYSREKDFFNQEEIKLLDEMASDISLALQNISAERKRNEAERLVYENEQRYLDLYENSPDMFLSVDPRSMKILECNNTLATTLGYRKEEIIGKPIAEIYHPQSHYRMRDNRDAFLKTGKVLNSEMEILKKDGSILSVLLNSSAVYDKSGNIQYSRSVWHDVTAQRRLENEEKKLWRILKSSLNEIYIFNSSDLKFEFVNDGAVRNLGYTREELYKMTPVDIKPDFSEQTFLKLMEPLLNGTKELLHFETRHRRKNGTDYSVEVHLQLFTQHNRRIFVAIMMDITERIRTASALYNSQQRLISAQRIARMGDFILDIPTGKVTWSDGMYELLGYTRSEQITAEKMYKEIFHPEDLPLIQERLTEAINSASQVLAPMEFRVIKQTGETLYVRTQGIIEISGGKSNKIFATVQDVTERIKSELGIRESEEKFSKAFRNSPDGIIITSSPEGRIIDVNNSIVKLSGFTREELIGYTTTELNLWVNHEDRDRFVSALSKSTSISNFETLFRKKAGKVFTGLMSGELIKLNQSVYILSVIRDITERKAAEEALKESEERFRRISSTISDISYSCDSVSENSFSITWITGAVERITGYTREEIIRFGCWGKLVLPEDFPVFEKNIINLKPGATSICEVRIIHKMGIPVWIQSFAECVIKPENPGHKIIYGGLVDITQRKNSEELLRQKIAELEKFNNLSVGRELRMIELKGIINELRARLGEPPQFESVSGSDESLKIN